MSRDRRHWRKPPTDRKGPAALRHRAVHRAGLRTPGDDGRQRRHHGPVPAGRRVRPAAADHPPAVCAPWSTSATCGRSRPGSTPSARASCCSAESSSTMLSVVARPHLDRLVDELGETANLAIAGRRRDRLHRAGAVPALDADVHRGRPPGAAALHGRRQGDHGPHAAGPGAGPAAAHRHAASTPSTPSPTPETFAEQLRWVGEHGYAIDDGEQEHGVRCVAVAVPDAPDQARTLGQRAGHPDDAGGHRTHVPDPARGRGRPLPRPLLTVLARRGSSARGKY